MGIAHVWGMEPITVVAEGDWRVAFALGAFFPTGFAWWLVHLRNNSQHPGGDW